MRINLIFQARANSTRLKNKIFKKINNKTILELFIDRVTKTKKIDKIILATTKNVRDNKTIKIAKKKNISFFRGPEKNVLSRYYQAAKLFKSDLIVRCNADCPFIDPKLIDKMITLYRKDTDYFSNIIEETFPSGQHIEIFTFDTLKKAFLNATTKTQKEHVTPYIYNNKKKFKIKSFRLNKNLSNHRWTIDYKEDLVFIKEVYKKFNFKNNFKKNKIIKLLKKYPQLRKINYHIPKKQNLISK